MPQKYMYLFLDAFTILGPFFLSFDKKVSFYKDWKFLFPSLLIVSSFYVVWDIIFTQKEIWSFNHEYLVGLFLFDLPLEEWLFFIVVPYACLFIYRCLETYFPKINFSLHKLYPLVLGISIIITLLSWQKWYTFITFGILSISMITILMIPQFKKIIHTKANYLWLSWMVSAIPMFYVNGKLTSLPVVIYDNEQNLALRLGTIPVEDFFYNLLYIFWLVVLYETFKNKQLSKKHP